MFFNEKEERQSNHKKYMIQWYFGKIFSFFFFDESLLDPTKYFPSSLGQSTFSKVKIRRKAQKLQKVWSGTWGFS